MTTPAWTLAIETSTRQGSLALMREGEFSAELPLELGTAHGQSLLPCVASLLRQEGLSTGDLRLVAVSQGPGSYTGLRVGVVCAKLLAWSLQIPLVAVDTLRALAAGHNTPTARLWVVTDAQRDAVYAGCFALETPHRPATLIPTMVLPVHQLVSQIRSEDVVRGLAVDKLLEVAPEMAGQSGGEPLGPTARWVGSEGIASLRRGELSDPRSLTPVYLRQSSAETQWDRLHPNAG
jgi:tRNA threonylcarbamoyladenosine biosynthesis protein TsaB